MLTHAPRLSVPKLRVRQDYKWGVILGIITLVLGAVLYTYWTSGANREMPEPLAYITSRHVPAPRNGPIIFDPDSLSQPADVSGSSSNTAGQDGERSQFALPTDSSGDPSPPSRQESSPTASSTTTTAPATTSTSSTTTSSSITAQSTTTTTASTTTSTTRLTTTVAPSSSTTTTKVEPDIQAKLACIERSGTSWWQIVTLADANGVVEQFEPMAELDPNYGYVFAPDMRGRGLVVVRYWINGREVEPPLQFDTGERVCPVPGD